MTPIRFMLLTLCLGLAACAHQQRRTMEPERLPENVIESPQTYSHVLTFSEPENVLSEGEIDSLEVFLSTNRVGYGDVLSLRVHSADPGWQTKMAALNSYLKTQGLWVWNAEFTDALPGASSVSLQVNRYSVKTPDCYNIGQEPFPKGQTSRWPIFGCITAHNLGMMVATPQDLSVGQPDSGPHAFYATRAIQLFRSRFSVMSWETEPATSLVNLSREERREDARSGEDKGQQ